MVIVEKKKIYLKVIQEWVVKLALNKVVEMPELDCDIFIEWRKEADNPKFSNTFEDLFIQMFLDQKSYLRFFFDTWETILNDSKKDSFLRAHVCHNSKIKT